MINIEQLTKIYPSGKGIKNLSFKVEEGEIYGFLGPNGAGKTTTIRILMGFLRPDFGTVRIGGLDSWQDRTELKRVIGYLPGELHFFDKLSGEDLLMLMIDMHGNNLRIKQDCQKLIQRFDLDIHQPIRKMSKGMKQKLGIISAFMKGAEILILDEPTSGLDPLMQKIFIDLVLEERERGTTILMSSHQFSEIEKTCERIGIIREGELLAIEDITSLKKMKCQTFDIRVETDEDAQYLRESGLYISAEDELLFTVAISGDLNVLWKVLTQIRITEFYQRPLELEETFMQFYC